MSSRRRRRVASSDMTPMIDVLFMLIIFFVLTTTFARGAISVALPRGGAAPAGGEPVVVTVTADGAIFWGGDAIASSDVEARASAARESGDDIVIAADSDASFGTVADLIESLRRAGVENVGIAYSQGGAR